MNKKLGITVIIGVIILTCILAISGIIYSSFNNEVYAAETRADFSFAKENGKVKTYKFPLDEQFDFNMILPEGVKKEDVSLSEKNNNGTIVIEKTKEGYPAIRGVKLGSGTLRAQIKVGKVTYETYTEFTVVEREFSFPISNKAITEYTGKNALKIGEEKSFKLKLPSGYSMNDIEYSENGNGILQIDNSKKVVVGKKVGTTELLANIKGTSMYTRTKVEVVSSSNVNNEDKNSINNTQSNNNQKYTISKLLLKFNEEQKIINYNGKTTTTKISATTSGILVPNFKWETSDPSILEVKSINGKTCTFSVKKPGKVTVKVSYPERNLYDTMEVIVYSNNLFVFQDNKDITDNTVTINVGESFKIDMKDVNGVISNDEIKYTSSNGKVCTISTDGVIKGLSKGTVTIKGMRKNSTKCYGSTKINVVNNEQEKISSGLFSFPIDPETNKVKEYKGKYAFVVGSTYEFDMIKPEGAENYNIEYSCSNKDLFEIKGESIIPIATGRGTLIAKMKIGDVTKTATTKFEIYASMTEKEQAGGTEIQYINLSFDKEVMAVEKNNTITLKPVIDTNIPKKDFKLNWTVSDNQYVQIKDNSSSNTCRVTPIKSGKVNVTVSVEGKENIKATIELDIKEKVVLVSSIKFSSDFEKKNGAYILKTGQPYNMNFTVFPSNATNGDYEIEVEDKDNFLVNGKTVIPLNPNVKTKLTAKSLDSGNKSTTITIESIVSDEELLSIPSILDFKDSSIQVNIDETINIRKIDDPKRISYTKSGNNFTLDNSDDKILTIKANKLGKGAILFTYNNEKYKIPVEVVQNIDNSNIVNKVTAITFPIDANTGKTVDLVNDKPLVVNEYYDINVNVYPNTADNKDIKYTVSDNSAFTITPNGKVVANKPNKTATLTATSVSNPDVKSVIKIASVENSIKSIKFAKDYVGQYALTTFAEPWDFNLIITLSDGTTFNPVIQPEITNNETYKRYLEQIVITTEDTKYINVKNNSVTVVRGINGTGTLKAYLKNNKNVTASAKFESIGLTENEKISKVYFAKNSYDIYIDDGIVHFCPIIELTSGRILDPSKDYGQVNSVANSAEYKNYLSQLQLIKISGENGLNSTDQLVIVREDNNGPLIDPKYGGKAELGFALKGSNDVLDKTIINVFDGASKKSNNDITADIKEIEHANTTTNKNLKITNIKFVEKSYNLTEKYTYHFNTVITLSDGTVLNKDSKDQDIYKYYMGLTEIYLVNDNNSSTIDFGVVEVNNNESPRYVVPLKNGKVILAVGSKQNNITYDTTVLNVNINK